MLKNRKSRVLWKTLCIFAILTTVSIFAAGGKDLLELRYEVFQDNNGTSAHTPVLHMEKTFDGRWDASWSQEVDAVTGASRYAGDEKLLVQTDWTDGTSGATYPTSPGESNVWIDGISGASKSEIRYSETFTIGYNRKGRVLTASMFFSDEDDYVSRAPGISGSWDFFDRNLTLSGGWSHYWDNYLSRPGFPTGGTKQIDSWTAGLAQSLTPLTLVSFGLSLSESYGYLGKPYQPVTLDAGPLKGAMMPEFLPDFKTALALAPQVVQGWKLSDLLGSANLSYRWYEDSWGLRSHTAELRLLQHLNDEDYLRLRYRKYWQKGADFVLSELRGSEKYRTADIRFYPFNSQLFGIKYHAWFPESWDWNWFPQWWDAKFDITLRDTEKNFKLYQYGKDLIQLEDEGEGGGNVEGFLSNYLSVNLLLGVGYEF